VTALSSADLGALHKTQRSDDAIERVSQEVDGAKLEIAIEPRDDQSLARSVATLAERGIGAIVRGGGTRIGFGNPPRGARVLLSTRRLAGVVEVDADEGVVRALAGTPLGEVRDEVLAAGWLLPFDAPGTHTTLGGVLATAAIGPRHLGFGRPRDLVLGLDVVLGDGARTRCGGRVVKNVTGYDLMKLQIGAHGAFGVIRAAWLRLRPLPESERTLSAVIGSDAASIARAVAAARRSRRNSRMNSFAIVLVLPTRRSSRPERTPAYCTTSRITTFAGAANFSCSMSRQVSPITMRT
jgi:FAD/FMN-containing dehydrogenase